MDIHQAVKQLRTRLGLSQQVFATRLELSIRAIVHYENDRVPGARPLAQLERFATQHEQVDLAEFFNAALASSLRLARTKRTWLTPDELWLQSAFARCVFENPDTAAAKKIRKILEPYLQQLRKEDAAAHRALASQVKEAQTSGEQTSKRVKGQTQPQNRPAHGKSAHR